MKKRKPVRHTPRTPKRLKMMGGKRGDKRPLMIDARPETDERVLPARVNGGSLDKRASLTFDRFAELVGGRAEFINACRLSDAPEAMEFVRLCEVEGDKVRLEQILDHMNVKGGKILESVVPAMYERGCHVDKFIIALHSPSTTLAVVKTANIVGSEGHADRKMLLEAIGVVQKSGGMTVIGQLNAAGGIERPEATYSGTAMLVEEDE